MRRGDQFVPAHPAPRRQVFGRAWIVRGEFEHAARRQRLEAEEELEHELAAAHRAGVPAFWRLGLVRLRLFHRFDVIVPRDGPRREGFTAA